MSEHDTGDTLRERMEANRYWFWLLLTGNRWLVAGGLAAAAFALLMLLGTARSTSLRVLASTNVIKTLFASLVGALITSTTLVVSINQLVLSQEIGSLGGIQNRMANAMDVRQNTDELLGMTTPVEPATYLAALVRTSEERAVALREAVADSRHGDLREAVNLYVANLVGNADHSREDLVDSKFGGFDVIPPALDFGYNRKVNDLRWLAREYETELTTAQRDRVRELLTALTMYGTIREYVVGLYIQWALLRLSRAILYTAAVALPVAGAMALFVDPTTFTGTFLGAETVLWVVSAAFTLSILPFFIFTSYILRVATLAKQTFTVEPFLLH